MKISVKQFATGTFITEQLFLNDVQIGLMTKVRGANKPWKAILLKNGVKVDLGSFSGDVGRRDAKNIIIEKFGEIK